MHHDAHIGLVYPHAEGGGGHHDARPALFPAVLTLVFLLGREAGVVKLGADPGLGKQLGNHRGAFATAHIHDAHQRGLFLLAVAHDV